MLRNSQFSHILLLIVLGYAIYYLTCPQKTVKNKGTLEQITSESNKENTESPRNSSSVSEKVHDELSSASESKGIISEVEQELNQKSDSEKSTNSQVNNFEPVETKGGASLNNAFNKPTPKGANINTIDFNKDFLKKYDSKNYLPKEVNDEWFDTDFTQAKKVGNDNLINTEKYVIGVDTVGQSLKNASWDIRGTVANPKFNVSPWLNSTYEPDYNIKPLC